MQNAMKKEIQTLDTFLKVNIYYINWTPFSSSKRLSIVALCYLNNLQINLVWNIKMSNIKPERDTDYLLVVSKGIHSIVNP